MKVTRGTAECGRDEYFAGPSLSNGPCSPNKDLQLHGAKTTLTKATASAKAFLSSTNKVYFVLTTGKGIQCSMSIFSFSREVIQVLLKVLGPLPIVIFFDKGLKGAHAGSSQEQDTNESNCSMTAESLTKRKCVTSAQRK